MIYLYTKEGFLFDSLNPLLGEQGFFASLLHLYYTLLQASIEFAAKKFNAKPASKAISKVNGADYFVFHRAAKISETFLLKEIEALKLRKTKFFMYNELLYACTNAEQCFQVLSKPENNNGGAFAPAIFNLLIKKETANENPSLFCFLYDINPKCTKQDEVLLSSCVTFKLLKIEKAAEGRNYEITAEYDPGYASNDNLSSSKYDSLINSCVVPLKEIRVCLRKDQKQKQNNSAMDSKNFKIEDLRLLEILLEEIESVDEAVKEICEALTRNSTVEKLDFLWINVSAEGAKALGLLLKSSD